MATAMMQAIAAAKKSEKKKKKAPAKEPPAKPPLFEAGDRVLYWSESKRSWVDAEVLRRREADGTVAYDLNLKSKAPQAKVRPVPGEGEAFDRSAPPPPEAPASAFASFDAFGGKAAKKRGRDSDSEDGERRRARAAQEQAATFEWGSPPPELLAREAFGEHDAPAFIDHFVRHFVGAWEEQRRAGFPAFADADRRAFGGDALEEARRAVVPLLVQLARGERLERGETKDEKIKMCGGRTACDGRHVDEAGVLEQLHRIASSAAVRDYAEAHKAYMKLTLGHKKWNNTCVTHVSASTMQGAREYRRNRDSLNTYDMDPVAQKYMQAMRKIVHFAQRIRPNDDQSKNVVI
mmetsp:Transcript_114827/g.303236  ORF Transcript_114827/g.303236 Transcript_114827/m.303236 type:complete len:349 (-) Transcript_114827:58-1104(-)